MKEYIRNDNIDDIKDILKIRLHMWYVKQNCQKMAKIQYVQFTEKKHILDFDVELEKGKHTIGSQYKPLETDTKDF